jgi:hypothetical protein
MGATGGLTGGLGANMSSGVAPQLVGGANPLVGASTAAPGATGASGGMMSGPDINMSSALTEAPQMTLGQRAGMKLTSTMEDLGKLAQSNPGQQMIGQLMNSKPSGESKAALQMLPAMDLSAAVGPAYAGGGDEISPAAFLRAFNLQ